jgi:hypothetical protein
MALRSAVHAVSVLASKYTGRSLLYEISFLYGFTLMQLENLRHFSNLRKTFGLMQFGIDST